MNADPKYAPAWACLARAYRYIGKFVEDAAGNLARAEEAFQRAFELNPDLALAHNFYTAHETDLGRSLHSMPEDRLGRVASRRVSSQPLMPRQFSSAEIVDEHQVAAALVDLGVKQPALVGREGHP